MYTSLRITLYDVTLIMGLEPTSARLRALCFYQLSSGPVNIMVLKLVYLELLIGAIGSPQGPAHYNVMNRVFNKVRKK